jgi:hypothetical protein
LNSYASFDLISAMTSPEYTEAVNAKVDEWLTLASQSYITPNTKDYNDLLSLMADEDQIVIDAVVKALNASEEHHQS